MDRACGFAGSTPSTQQAKLSLVAANEVGIRGSAAIIVGFMLLLLIPDAGRIGVDKARPHNMDLGKAFQLTYLVVAPTRTGQSRAFFLE